MEYCVLLAFGDGCCVWFYHYHHTYDSVHGFDTAYIGNPCWILLNFFDFVIIIPYDKQWFRSLSGKARYEILQPHLVRIHLMISGLDRHLVTLNYDLATAVE